jgi:hypothetical protein
MIQTMRTRAGAGVFLALLVTVSSARAADVTYFDRSKNAAVTERDITIVEEGVSGLSLRIRGRLVKVSALDVRDVRYGAEDVKPLPFGDYIKPGGKMLAAALPSRAAERPKLYAEVIQDITDLLPKVPRELKRVRRHLEYQQAEALYRLSQLEPARRADALVAVTKFKQDYADGWQLAPALMFLAQMQEEKGDAAAVEKTYEELAAVPGISDEIRTTSLLKVVHTLMKGEKYAAAEVRLQDLKKSLPPDGAEAGKVKVYLAQCQVLGNDAAKAEQAEKQLRELVAGGDASLKALIHNTLGEYLLKKNKGEAAFWEFLRVDVLYSADKNEHARALYHLAKLFREVKKDGVRADSYLDQLKEKRFEGTEYQKKALEK